MPWAAMTFHLECRVAHGLVVAGDLIGRGSAQEQAMVGETPNLAARLQGLAGSPARSWSPPQREDLARDTEHTLKYERMTAAQRRAYEESASDLDYLDRGWIRRIRARQAAAPKRKTPVQSTKTGWSRQVAKVTR